jgi:hypothetical protein
MAQRSPLILVLLVAATLAVDAVSIYWVLEGVKAGSPTLSASILYDALCFGQIGVACVWVVFDARHRIWAAPVLGLGTLAAGVATATLFELKMFEAIAFIGAYATLLVILLWIVKHTRLWRAERTEKKPLWQFSVAQLLALMTVIAVLLAMFRGSEIIQDIGTYAAADIILSSVLVVATVVISGMPWPLLIRLAATLAMAAAFGLADWTHAWWCAAPDLKVGVQDIPISLASGLIQSLMIIIWLDIGRIIPRAATGRTRDEAPITA